ncbi:uncharacterized protein LOC113472091 [Diaphorina citri]|jgi:hypothetical protein|uniref:Uncharacterized protein LOC113472091 n=1 Tax=Diaphorina citri TaxID=121845 RepID=A0A3Q0JJY6_DIACI|nr:uncharacterized protein LOC113472091 [Diaphorina citri]
MLKWWIKLLEMPDTRYPKMCYEELKRIEYYEPLKKQHNWAAQIRQELLDVGKEELYNSVSTETVKQEIENILQIHRQKNMEEDTRRITSSSYSTQYKNISNGPNIEKYLTFDLRTGVIRTVSHLRVASDERIQIYTNNCSYVVNSTENCTLCNLKERETLEHILLKCPVYAEARTWIRPYIERENPLQSLINLLCLDSIEKVTRLGTFISNCMKIRSFIIFE